MFKDPSSLRNFKGGSWDLRKKDRRQTQASIAFPDRRAQERRGPVPQADGLALHRDSLTWVSKSALDE